MTQRTASERAAENARKEIYAQSELMRQQEKLNQGDFYAPTNYERGVNSGGGVFSFGQDFGSPYRTDTLNDLKQTVPTVSPYELGEADLINPLENIQDAGVLTQQYYDNVDKLNFLAKEAASQGWNITQMNFRDPNKRALSEAYQQLKTQTLDLGNTLKGGYEVREQGIKDGRFLEHQGLDTGEGTRHIYTSADIGDTDMYNTVVDDINRQAKQYERSDDKDAADSYLETRRQALMQEANDLYKRGLYKQSELAKKAAMSIGLADQSLGEEELAWDKEKFNYGKSKDMAQGIKLIDDTRLLYDQRNYRHTDKGYINTELSGQVIHPEYGVLDYVEYKDGQYIGHYNPVVKGDKKTGVGGQHALPRFENMMNMVATSLYGNKATEALNSVGLIQNNMVSEKGYGVYDSKGDLDSHWTSGTFYDPSKFQENIEDEKKKVYKGIYDLGTSAQGKNTNSWWFDNAESSSDKRNVIIQDYLKAKKGGSSKEELDRILNKAGDLAGSVQHLTIPKNELTNTPLGGYDEIFLVGSSDSAGGIHVMGYDNSTGETTKITIGEEESGEGYRPAYVVDYFESTGLGNKIPEVKAIMSQENQSLSQNVQDIISSTEKAFGRPLTQKEKEEIINNNPESASQRTYGVYPTIQNRNKGNTAGTGQTLGTW